MKYNGIFEGKIILIVEDHTTCFLLLKELLLPTGALIYYAGDGYSAVRMCKANPDINAVLMDIKLPGINGLVATKMIKSIRKNLPVIAISAAVFEKEKKNCFQAGCDDFIEKPVHQNTLYGVLSKWIFSCT
ncbi:MAG: response regulator [Bacteroidota bacterium]